MFCYNQPIRHCLKTVIKNKKLISKMRDLRVESALTNKGLFLTVIFLFIFIQHALCLEATSSGKPISLEKKRDVSQDSFVLPDSITPEEIDSVIAPLTDSKIRFLLIEALKKDAAETASKNRLQNGQGLIAGFIKRSRDKIEFLRQRIHFLISVAGKDHAGLEELIKHPSMLKDKKRHLYSFIKVLSLFMAAGFLSLFFSLLIRKKRVVFQSPHPDLDWGGRIIHMGFLLCLDAAGLIIFTASMFILSSIYTESESLERFLTTTYLMAIIIIQCFRMLSRLILSPHANILRVVPLEDETSRYLYRWFHLVVITGTFGWMTCGLFRLIRVDEATHITMVGLVGLISTMMLAFMIFQQRKKGMIFFNRQISTEALRDFISPIWHYLAITYLFILWFFWGISLIFVGVKAMLPAIFTLMSIPFFLLTDWMIQSLLLLVTQSGYVQKIFNRPFEGRYRKEDEDMPGSMALFFKMMRFGLRLSLIATIFFWLLSTWGIHFTFGITMARAVLNILITILICYIAWELIRIPIERKLEMEFPKGENAEGQDEGSGGGSRMGTLLLLLKKFIFVVLIIFLTLISLSSMGIDIAPLIAGAGVVGLAIGFGAQTLVKDIISGLFFLIDDAFRVGDYVDTGQVKGVVEQISLRSLRLRHHRGMVHTIPFGDIGSVTNFSRDYIIMKLSLRVRFDADINTIRKVIKKINKSIHQEDAFKDKLLSKIKSQGITAMDDSAMIVRVKFKSIPGEQFVLRREIFQRIQNEFQSRGIEFAHRNVTVHMPESMREETPDLKTAIAAGGIEGTLKETDG